MKTDILKFFRTDRSYNGGISLYMRYGNRISLRKQLNLQSETKQLKEMLFEELRSMAGIDHKQFQAILRTPILKETPVAIMEEVIDPLEIPVIIDQTEEPASLQEDHLIQPETIPEPEPVPDPIPFEKEIPIVQPKPDIPKKFIKPRRKG